MEYIVTNFAYGTGPYLRTTDLAIAFNDELERHGHGRMGIIVPWVYGQKQRRVMLEEFRAYDATHPGEILLDAELGALLGSVFYGGMTYEQALCRWVASARDVSQRARDHLSGMIDARTLSGELRQINGKNIVIELNRSPRIRYDVAPPYFTSFASIAEILERAQRVKEIAVAPDLLHKGIAVADWVERDQRMRAIAYPGTFSYATSPHKMYDIASRTSERYQNGVLVPPIAPLPRINHDEMEPGIFVTVTGIPGLERLYADARRLGLTIYSNDTAAVPGSRQALPWVIPNKNILLQFARSGWSSVWISMIAGTPLVVPDFDPKDDPEIYFNNRAVEELGIGIVYRGQPLEEILKESDHVKSTSARLVEDIKARWGTLDGNRYSARLFAYDFLGSN